MGLVVLGAHVLHSSEPTRQVLGISTVVRHPDYQPTTHANDICLLQVSLGGHRTRVWPVPGHPHVLKTAVRSCEHPSQIMSRLCPLCLPHGPLGAPWGQTEPSVLPPCPLRPGLCTGRVPSRAPFPQTPHGFVPQPFPVFPQMSPPLGPPSRSPCHLPSPGPPISPSRPSVPTSSCPPQLKPFASSPTFTASSSRLGAQGF